MTMAENLTLYYQGHRFYKDQKITLAYGSSSDKSFAFVLDKMFMTFAPATFAKTETTIIKWRQTNGVGKYWLVLKVIGASRRLEIDLEGAVDNHEIVLDERYH